MSSHVIPRSVLRKIPMRAARNTVPGLALETHSACESIMPSISVSLTIRLLMVLSTRSSDTPTTSTSPAAVVLLLTRYGVEKLI